MDPKKTINALIKVGPYTEAENQSFINDTPHMTSTQEVLNYLLTNVGNSIDDEIQFVKEQGLKEEMRKFFRPEIQFWFLKIQITGNFELKSMMKMYQKQMITYSDKSIMNRGEVLFLNFVN